MARRWMKRSRRVRPLGGASTVCFACSNTCSFFRLGLFFETAQLHCRRFILERNARVHFGLASTLRLRGPYPGLPLAECDVAPRARDDYCA